MVPGVSGDGGVSGVAGGSAVVTVAGGSGVVTGIGTELIGKWRYLIDTSRRYNSSDVVQ